MADDERPGWAEREKKSFSELDRMRREGRSPGERRPRSPADQARAKAATQQYLNEIEYQQVKNMAPAQLKAGRPPNEYGEYQGSMSNHEDVYANVHNVLTSSGLIGTVGYEGLKTIEIIDKIYTAARLAG